MNHQRGFSILEVITIVAIIGVLAAVAIPGYRDYVLRARLAEVVQLAASARSILLSEYYTRGEMPKSNSEVARRITALIETSEIVDRVVFIRYGHSPHYAAFEVWLDNIGPRYDNHHWTFDFLPVDGDPGSAFRMHCDTYFIPGENLPATCRK